jgi:hypothetical protein
MSLKRKTNSKSKKEASELFTPRETPCEVQGEDRQDQPGRPALRPDPQAVTNTFLCGV